MLKPFLIVLVTLILVSTIIWAFPGAWALTAVVPAFIIGGTIAHLRRPRDEGAQIRPGVVVLGGIFSLMTGAMSVLVMWAATADEAVTIEVERRIAAPIQDVWGVVGEPTQRPRWNTWLIDIEVKGGATLPAVGTLYRSTIDLGQHQVMGGHRVTRFEPPTAFAWTIEPPEGARLEDMIESIDLAEADGGKTVVQYRMTYAVRSVVARVFDRLVIRQDLRKVAEKSVELLAAAARE